MSTCGYVWVSATFHRFHRKRRERWKRILGAAIGSGGAVPRNLNVIMMTNKYYHNSGARWSGPRISQTWQTSIGNPSICYITAERVKNLIEKTVGIPTFYRVSRLYPTRFFAFEFVTERSQAHEHWQARRSIYLTRILLGDSHIIRIRNQQPPSFCPTLALSCFIIKSTFIKGWLSRQTCCIQYPLVLCINTTYNADRSSARIRLHRLWLSYHWRGRCWSHPCRPVGFTFFDSQLYCVLSPSIVVFQKTRMST